MDLTFIDIVLETGHETSFSIWGNKESGFIRMMGGISHGQKFRPKTAWDRKKLVNYLLSLDYSKERG